MMRLFGHIRRAILPSASIALLWVSASRAVDQTGLSDTLRALCREATTQNALPGLVVAGKETGYLHCVSRYRRIDFHDDGLSPAFSLS
jgi:hypothetical protein